MSKEYSVQLQKLFLEMMLSDHSSFVRVSNIYNSENFDRSIRTAASFIKEHSEKYKTLPTIDQIKATTDVELKPAHDLGAEHYDWFLEEFEGFTRRAELERAILKAADLIDAGDFSPVEKLIKDAVQISLTKDMGTDYFADPKARLRALKDGNGQLSTGWASMDKLLYGGFNRGELQIFAGGSGSGKSLVMQNLAVNWSTVGLNGVYITMELSEGLCSMRIDSMITGISSSQIFKDIDDVELKVRVFGKRAGNLRVKYLPAGSNVNDMRAYLKELQVQTGKKVDFVCVDYLDLASPAGVKVNVSDQFVKDKYVSEEFRNLAKELNVLFVTASQLNRSAVEEVEFDHSHIAGGISKINTADNVFGIFTSRAMRERGRYQVQCMKSRSSAGIGHKIDLDFNIESLRITDPGPQGQETNGPPKSSDILGQIRGKMDGGDKWAKPRPKEGIDPFGPSTGSEAQSTTLKKMLSALKSSKE